MVQILRVLFTLFFAGCMVLAWSADGAEMQQKEGGNFSLYSRNYAADGQAAYDAGDHDKAIKILRFGWSRLGEDIGGEAMFLLGKLTIEEAVTAQNVHSQEGGETSKQLLQGQQFLELSVAAGSKDAAAYLMEQYSSNDPPFAQNVQKAKLYMLKAAELGHYLAGCKLGRAFYDGLQHNGEVVIEQDYRQALNWLEACRFDSESLSFASGLHMSGKAGEVNKLRAIAIQDYRASLGEKTAPNVLRYWAKHDLEMAEILQQQGHLLAAAFSQIEKDAVASQMQLFYLQDTDFVYGLRLYHGIGLPQNKQKAISIWRQDALELDSPNNALQGAAASAYSLYKVYLESDPKAASHYLRLAAEHNHNTALKVLEQENEN